MTMFAKCCSPTALASSRSEWKQRFMLTRYLCVLCALLPFVLLRLTYFSDVAFPFKLPSSSPTSFLQREESSSHLDEQIIPSDGSVVEPTKVAQGSLIRPDEDAWTTHDDWIYHHVKNRGVGRKDSHERPRKRVSSDEDRLDFIERLEALLLNEKEGFGLPEDNEKEVFVLMQEKTVKSTEDEPIVVVETNHRKEEAEKDWDGVESEKLEQEKKAIDGHQYQSEGQKNEDSQRPSSDEEQRNIHEEEKKRVDESGEVDHKREESEEEERYKELKSSEEKPGSVEQEESKDKEEEKLQVEDSRPTEEVKTPSETNEEATSGQCDLFDGDWEHDPEGPLYTNWTCHHIQSYQNCMANGRPDTGYLHWKWKPRDCDLPRLDPKTFLTSFRGKGIGFVGDSLARNQMQSLLCLLTQVETPTEIFKTPDEKTIRWLFEEHQVTVAVVWSPYLLKESTEGILGYEEGQSVLYLDVLDTLWTSMLPDLDIVVLSVGQWYLRPAVYIRQAEAIGCHACPNLNLTQIGFYFAYGEGLRFALEKVTTDFKGIVILSTFAISHFENGTWDNSGQCTRLKPLSAAEGAAIDGLHNEMRDIVLSEFKLAANDTTKVNKDVHLEFLDVTKVSLQRADGHPGAYRLPNPFEGKNPDEMVTSDCLHWCIPGPVDTWNQLLVQIAQKHM